MKDSVDITNTICPLCRRTETREYSRDKRRNFIQCKTCDLVFVPSVQFLSTEEEKKRYDLHQNSPEDTGYRRFLDRLFQPLHQCLQPGSAGLDFGSGPEPLLSRMFEEAGHSMAIYDRYYEPVPVALENTYDFITASEVVEHLRDPRKELDQLWACLKPEGLLGIMTKFAVERDAFPQWHYKNDLTHICFYSRATFDWLARSWNADLRVAETDVVIFHKKT